MASGFQPLAGDDAHRASVWTFDGQALQPQSLTREFQRFVVRLTDIPRVRFNDVRHSHATQLLAAGVHPKVAQERLGHSTVATTVDRYSHVTATMQEHAAGRLDTTLGLAIRGVASRK